MAYINPEKGYMFPVQSDLPWTQTFRMTLRAPAIANRIFDTLAHAQAYIDDYSDKASAVPNLLLCVGSDTNIENNGFWWVTKVRESENDTPGTMQKISSNNIVVANLTTALESYTSPGIYFVFETTNQRGYVMFIQAGEGNTTIQTLMHEKGYQYRTGAGAVNTTISSWTAYTTKYYVTDVDAALDENSENPVQNKILKELLDNINTQITNISSVTGKVVIEVENEAALANIENPEEGIIYITQDTNDMYIYNASEDEFINVTDSIVNGVIYVKNLNTLLTMEPAITKGIYTVVHSYTKMPGRIATTDVYSLMVSEIKRRLAGSIVEDTAMTLSNAKKFAEKIYLTDSSAASWEWHTYSFEGHTHTTDAVYTLDGKTLTAELEENWLFTYAGLA